jgi:hypothetical protein
LDKGLVPLVHPAETLFRLVTARFLIYINRG